MYMFFKPPFSLKKLEFTVVSITQTCERYMFSTLLQGPALCFYNNEVFSEEDWRGIKMIYSSVKEEDPLKVGRFGLGFKSVFHITGIVSIAYTESIRHQIYLYTDACRAFNSFSPKYNTRLTDFSPLVWHFPVMVIDCSDIGQMFYEKTVEPK